MIKNIPKMYSLAIFTLLSLGLFSCKPPTPVATNATDCATVVQKYLGITDPVAVTKYVKQSSVQQVDIEYQSQNDENIPINGMASCVFSTPESAEDRLISVSINNQPLTKENIAALNQQVNFSR